MSAAIRLARRYAERHPGEAARRLQRLPHADVAAFLAVVDRDAAARLLGQLLPALAARCLQQVDRALGSEILLRLPIGDGVGVLRHVEESARGQLLQLLPDELADRARRLLRFPEGSAGAIADPTVPPVLAGQVVAEVETQPPAASVPYLYVVDAGQHLVGVVHRRDLARHDPGTAMESIMTRGVVRIPALAPAAALRRHPAWDDLDALPVVDEADVFLGVIRHKTVRRLASSAAGGEGLRSPLGGLLDLGEVCWPGLYSLLTTDVSGPPAAGAAGKETP